jgi:hypothetical protein
MRARLLSWGVEVWRTSRGAGARFVGTLRVNNGSNSPSASPHEDTTNALVMPFMAAYINLVHYDPTVPRNSFATIIPKLASA